ncbi:MAG: hypothetical protein H6704_02405 [Myxococcales bacterium]|nr:hypothetical protein [Myxococcales bacterium]
MGTRLRWALALFLAFGAACDDDTSSPGGGAGGAGGGGGDLDGSFDARPGGRDGTVGGRDARPGGDGGLAGLAGFREPCEDNLDCQSGWCVPFENRNVCTIPCLDEGCPGGWGCHAVANTQPDVVFICFPPGNRLCGVCLSDDDCPGGQCYALDGINVCGVGCTDDTSCPQGYTCDTVDDEGTRQCTPVTRSCSCDASRDGQVRVCEKVNAQGACFGRETCDAEQGWVGCDAPEPAAEVCNQVDDDCNGFTDDIVGLGDVCEREVDLDGDRIACSGRLVCTRESLDPQCTAPEPMGEACNFLDDDCDGATDEDFPTRGELCEVGVGQCRRVGVQICAEDGSAVVCDAEPGEAVAELCNGLDDDCDGSADEDFPGLNELCSDGVGACRRAGALRCAPDGQTAVCTAVAAEPGPEICDGIDNDCDGASDEGYEGLFDPCTVGVGACRRQGFRYCTEDGSAVACNAAAAEPVDELCNGVDDDCDGQTDEAFDGLQQPCSVGEGLCQRAGVTVCSADGAAVVCNAEPVEPVDERCNGLDDDCDGEVDEAFPTLDDLCDVGVGACARTGILDCNPEGDGVVCTARPAEPQPDRCDGLDNDCDGQTDEGFLELDRACTAGVGACQRNGVFRCNAAGDDVACDAVPADPGEERCNGLDDDCDGTVDEGFPGVDELCSAGIGACRRAGVRVCSPDGAAVVCNAVADAPSDEVCDGVDNDCDGTPDEGYADLLTPCTVGVGLCQRTGVRVCSEDGAGTTCAVEAAPAEEEICDGLDNDCDGTSDEGFDGVNTACTVGVGACLRPGVRVCSAEGDAVVCDAEPGLAVAETCNGLDDDCDGTTDEGYDGLNTACTVGQGVCLAAGVRRCSADGARVECDAEPGPPAGAERCNGLDDDCDGRTDEGFAGLNTACTVGQGVCQAAGVRVCSPNGATVVCDAEAGQAAPETCNGLDDDCDGRTDETYANLGAPCSAGVGACLRNGVRACAPDGASVVCDAVAADPQPETCNGLDDNCDGRIDETFAGLNTACSAGVGACLRPGVRACSGDGAMVVCDAVAGPAAPESCNGLDDDCDGRTDETFAGLNTACSVGVGACQSSGVRVCRADGAGVMCDAVAGQPAAEACDALDNDCDGRTDEDYPTVGTTCSDGVGACLRQGVRVCRGDGAGVMCNAQAGQPAADVCNGIDDDCDGSADEDFPDLNQACTAGVGVCLRNGVRRCAAGGAATECGAQPGPSGAEQCNGLDDDCDGDTDELWPTKGQVCTRGQGLCRRSGVQVCDAQDPTGPLVCDADVVVGGAETCDYQDDDCDGSTDEGFVDGQGRYTTLAHCGACGTSCTALWDPNPAAFGVAPLCQVVAGAAQCGYTCLAGYRDADGRPGNGCELEIDPEAIYVATPQNGGNDAGACGTVDQPCATVTRGIARAAGDVTKTRVRVSDGVYRENVTLTGGVDVLGGHQRTTWLRDPELNVTILQGQPSAGTDRITVSAVGITQPTTFDGFVVSGVSPLLEGNAYGIYVRDSDANLEISNNRVLAGDGGRGRDGASGGSGQPGTDGQPGDASFLVVNPPGDVCFPNPGAAFIRSGGGGGGQRTCGGVAVHGGVGGGSKCPRQERQEGSGTAGSGPAAGPGGAGGWGFVANSPNLCTVSDGRACGRVARAGGLGRPGRQRRPGGAAAGPGQLVGGHWRGAAGQAGAIAQPGGGGGGGGAAAGVDIQWAAQQAADIGASGGGGGGSGGCAGTRAAPAAAPAARPSASSSPSARRRPVRPTSRS